MKNGTQGLVSGEREAANSVPSRRVPDQPAGGEWDRGEDERAVLAEAGGGGVEGFQDRIKSVRGRSGGKMAEEFEQCLPSPQVIKSAV